MTASSRSRPPGTLPGGQIVHRVEGTESRSCKGKSDAFVHNVTEKLLTYSLGRGLERFDRPTVEAISRQVAASDYRFSALVMEVVNSKPFQMQSCARAAKAMNLILKKQLPRRTFLRGMGTVAGPAAARRDGAGVRRRPPARRRRAWRFSISRTASRWTPGPSRPTAQIAALPDALPRTLAPLTKYRNDITVLSGLTVDGGRAHGDGPGDHGRAGASYLTGAHPKKTFGKDLQAGVSMDQYAASKIGNADALRVARARLRRRHPGRQLRQRL